MSPKERLMVVAAATAPLTAPPTDLDPELTDFCLCLDINNSAVSPPHLFFCFLLICLIMFLVTQTGLHASYQLIMPVFLDHRPYGQTEDTTAIAPCPQRLLQ